MSLVYHYDYFRAPWAEGDSLVRIHIEALIHYLFLEEEVNCQNMIKKKLIEANFIKRKFK